MLHKLFECLRPSGTGSASMIMQSSMKSRRDSRVLSGSPRSARELMQAAAALVMPASDCVTPAQATTTQAAEVRYATAPWTNDAEEDIFTTL
mmetsp:Transcript_16355/g.29748  ORF Transcript_16355/g.29748 Transcript_16355/m.29748 type:complete len:92 (-) Transcript_16355:210-485(-)